MNRKNMTISIVGVIAQVIFLLSLYRFNEGNSSYFVFNGVDVSNNYSLLVMWYLFFAVISFSTMGYVRQFLTKYGILLVTREHKKIKLSFKQLGRLTLFIIMMCTIQISLATVCSLVLFEETFSIANGWWLTMLLYIMTIVTLIYIQQLLELFLNETVALLIINSYVILSVILGGILIETGESLAGIYFLIPNFSMFYRIEAVTNVSSYLSYGSMFSILISLLVVLCMGMYYKFKALDFV